MKKWILTALAALLLVTAVSCDELDTPIEDTDNDTVIETGIDTVDVTEPATEALTETETETEAETDPETEQETETLSAEEASALLDSLLIEAAEKVLNPIELTVNGEVKLTAEVYGFASTTTIPLSGYYGADAEGDVAVAYSIPMVGNGFCMVVDRVLYLYDGNETAIQCDLGDEALRETVDVVLEQILAQLEANLPSFEMPEITLPDGYESDVTVPDEWLSGLPENWMESIPEEWLTSLPEDWMENIPEEWLTNLPENWMENIPEEWLTSLPEDWMERISESTLPEIPELPSYDECPLPDIDLSALMNDALAAIPVENAFMSMTAVRNVETGEVTLTLSGLSDALLTAMESAMDKAAVCYDLREETPDYAALNTLIALLREQAESALTVTLSVNAAGELASVTYATSLDLREHPELAGDMPALLDSVVTVTVNRTNVAVDAPEGADSYTDVELKDLLPIEEETESIGE